MASATLPPASLTYVTPDAIAAGVNAKIAKPYLYPIGVKGRATRANAAQGVMSMMEIMPARNEGQFRMASFTSSVSSVSPEMMKMMMMQMLWKIFHRLLMVRESTALPGHGHAREKAAAKRRPSTRKLLRMNALMHCHDIEGLFKK